MPRRRVVLVVVFALALSSLILLASIGAALIWTAPAPGVPYVAVLELQGVIDYEKPLLGGALTPRDFKELVDIVRGDPAARAVVLVVNSPGGTAAAFEVYEIVKELARDRVLVAYITGYGTSGGYLVTLPAKEIIAHPTALVGSVGAVAVLVNLRGLYEKLGINVTIVKSGDLKDVGSPYRNLTEDDLSVIQSFINEVAGVFASKVREHRGEKIRDWNEILRASVYPGGKAKELGLIDTVGTLEDAIKRARELARLPEDAPARTIRKEVSLIDILLGRIETPRIVSREPLSVEVLVMWPLPSEPWTLIVASQLQNPPK
ncbi:MAG: signal peptide peptidase SppA [Thermoprotei archaeon]|nr:signal peptide peptidase SppA [Thermoprotei archaeon]